jgi:hypothetical protein
VAFPRSLRPVLALAVLVTVSALAVAARGGATAHRRELAAPEAWAALERNDAERAAAIFRDALKVSPDDATLHYGAGSAAYALGRTAAALAAFTRAVELDPGFAEAQAMLGRVAYDRGDARLALQSMEKAAALRPRDRFIGDALARWRRESAVHESYLERPGERFRILYEGATQQSIGDRVSRVLEREYARIGRSLNRYPRETITVILYTDREFQDITRSPDWVAGRYDGRIRVAVGGSVAGIDLDRVVTHELVHAFVASAAQRRLPAWLDEGLATYLEGDDPGGWARNILRTGKAIVPLDSLVRGFTGLDEEAAYVAYAESAIAAEILCAKLGSNVGAFLELVGNGYTVDRALLEFQVQPDAFHSEWRRRVGLR